MTAQPDAGLSVPVLYDENPRRALAELAGRFFAFRPECTVGITGTNGKTSTAAFLRQFWTEAGLSAASLGTLGVVTQEFTRPINHTTPDPVTLHAALRDLYARGIDHLAMEVSSHALAQHRVDGLIAMLRALPISPATIWIITATRRVILRPRRACLPKF